MSDYSPTHWMKDIPDKPIRMGLYDPEKGCVRGRPINDYALKISVFQPEYFSVEKNLLRNIQDSLESGLEHTCSALIEHDSSLGRTTRKNKSWAEILEKDIRGLENCIKQVDKILVAGETHCP